MDNIEEYIKSIDYNEEDYQVNLDKKIEELRNNPNDICYAFIKQRPFIAEKELSTTVEDITPKLKRAYCPNCHKEINSRSSMMYNPYRQITAAEYICDCGFEFNLEHAYPRICWVDKNNNEVDIL